MLSFELSAIDLILAIAVIILLVLYLTKPPTEPGSAQSSRGHERRSLDYKTVPEEKTAEKVASFQNESEEREMSVSPKNAKKCHHHFGYLQEHAGNSSVPDECLNCLRVVECMFPKE